MTILGHVKGGIIVFDEPVELAEGAAVRVEVLGPSNATTIAPTPGPDALFRMDHLAVNTGIPDLATNIDHYLYGHPKVADGP